MTRPPLKKKASKQGSASRNAVAKRIELIGHIIRAERELKGWSQTELFAQCAAKENRLRAKGDGKRVFNSERNEGCHQVIVDIELGRRKRLRQDWLDPLEGVFGWPSGVLLGGAYTSVPGFKRLLSKPNRPRTSTDPAPGRNRHDMNALPPLHDRHISTGERLAFLKRLDAALRLNRGQRQKVTLLFGPAGIEKEDLIREWHRDLSGRAFNSVLAIDCTQPGDQFCRHLTKHFTGEEAEILDGLGAALTAIGKTLIVLVGLVEPQDPVSAAKPHAIMHIRTLLGIIAQSGAQVSVLMCVTSDADTDGNALAGRLGVIPTSPPLAVPPLDPKAAAELLRSYGVDFLSERDVENIAAEIAGLPLTLEYIAAYLKLLNKNDLDAFLAFDPDTPFSFDEFLKEYLKIAVPSDANDEAHPEAFLRFLALTPPSASKELLEYVLDCVEVGRLAPKAVASFVRDPPPGVRVSNNTFYLNTVVRNALWQGMAVALEKRDGTIIEPELTAIHASAARYFIDRLNSLTTENGDVWARMLEGAVHHLLCVAMLKQSAGVPKEAFALASIDDLANAKVDPASIVRFCFKELAERHLCDSAHYASRYMGLFETKADILMRFVQEGYVGASGAPAQMLDADQRVDLKIEIGISWLHSGRLQPAMDALLGARSESRRALSVSAAKLAKAWTNPSASATFSRRWRQRAQALSALALSQLRHGRAAEVVCGILTDDLAHAKAIAQNLTGERLRDEAHIGLANGARRIIGRRAHIDLARGGLESALLGFHAATKLQRAAGYECLDGELARRYIETLVRSRSSNPDHLKEANDIVERNLRKLTKTVKTQRQRESNEIIALYTTQAMLKRVGGRIDEAARILTMAAGHSFVRSGECPYTARKELEIEHARLKVMAVTNATRAALIQELRALEMELTNTRHAQLSRQVTLMHAEVTEDVGEREKLLDIVETQATTAGWLLRLKDVEVLRNGDSALHILGC